MTPEFHSDPKLEIAHVLTMGVVEYSTLLITEQTRIMAELTRIVKGTARFRRAEAERKLIRVPPGDGMLLVFFDDPQEQTLVAADPSGGAARACQTLRRRVSQSETATVER
jgi:hypothetical protein